MQLLLLQRITIIPSLHENNIGTVGELAANDGAYFVGEGALEGDGMRQDCTQSGICGVNA